MHTIATFFVTSWLLIAATFVFLWIAFEYQKCKPIRRHKRIKKIIARAKPIDRGYSTIDGYIMKVRLMDLRDELTEA